VSDRPLSRSRLLDAFARFLRTFGETFLANAVVFVAATFFWGVPGITIFRDVEWYDGSSVGLAFWLVAVGLVFFIWALVPQMSVYSLLLTIRPRRLWAVVFAPMAVGILFVFAEGSFGAAIFATGLTLSFGLSAYVPGAPAWWEGRPRRLLAAAAIFALACATAALSQRLPGSDRTSLSITVIPQDGQRKHFGLDCQYDQGGRVRGSEPQTMRTTPHPDGEQACRVLKSVEDAIADNREYLALNSRCPSPDVPFARITGVYRNRRVGEITVWREADCLESYLIRDEALCLVPSV
jgi:hypothetical protein